MFFVAKFGVLLLLLLRVALLRLTYLCRCFKFWVSSNASECPVTIYFWNHVKLNTFTDVDLARLTANIVLAANFVDMRWTCASVIPC